MSISMAAAFYAQGWYHCHSAHWPDLPLFPLVFPVFTYLDTVVPGLDCSLDRGSWTVQYWREEGEGVCLTTVVFKVQRRLVIKLYLYIKELCFLQVFERCLSFAGVSSLKRPAFQKPEVSSSENQRKIEALKLIKLLLLNTSLDSVDWLALFILWYLVNRVFLFLSLIFS